LFKKKLKSSFEIFNLGTGKGQTILEVINMFEKFPVAKLNYRFAPRRPGDVIKIYADCSLPIASSDGRQKNRWSR